MSDHEYVPSSKFGKWFNDRLPLLSLASHLTDYPTPKNLNYWWTLGGILHSIFESSQNLKKIEIEIWYFFSFFLNVDIQIFIFEESLSKVVFKKRTS